MPPAAGPPDVPAAHVATSPEEPLPLPGHQTLELRLLARAVQADGPHAVGAAEGVALALGEVAAAHPPAHQEVLSTELVVRLVTAPTSSSPTTFVLLLFRVELDFNMAHLSDLERDVTSEYSLRKVNIGDLRVTLRRLVIE